MLGIRHESYEQAELPFVLHPDLVRTATRCSTQQNWHDDLELQLCTAGSGYVQLNGVRHDLATGQVCVVPSGVLHYTYTETCMTYTALIIRTSFCESHGIDYAGTSLAPVLTDPVLCAQFHALVSANARGDDPLHRARTAKILLEMLLTLYENHAVGTRTPPASERTFDTVKAAILYLRAHYEERITLDSLARAVACDKYALCRAFKRYTGRTVVDFLNRHRTTVACDYLRRGCSVAESAARCGFDSAAFFSALFRRHYGITPTAYRRRI